MFHKNTKSILTFSKIVVNFRMKDHDEVCFNITDNTSDAVLPLLPVSSV